MLNCAKCRAYSCRKGALGRLPKECPIPDNADIYDKALAQYRDDPKQLAFRSAKIESAGFGVWPRIREIIEFAKLSGFSRAWPGFLHRIA